MSTQKGNTIRSRPQKHRNSTAFKNSLHDTSQRTKTINSIQVSDVCQRCKEIIEWKIKYKKYKPLTQPKTCSKCDGKCVKRAYHIMCDPCAQKNGVCAKCGQVKEIVTAAPSEQMQLELDQEMKELLKSLPERKRRTFLRYMEKGGGCNEDRDVVVNKLNQLKVVEEDDFDEEDE